MVQPAVDIPKSQSNLEDNLLTWGTVGVIAATLIVFLALIWLAGYNALLVAGNVTEWAAKTDKYWSFISTAASLFGIMVGLWLVWVKFFSTRQFASRLKVTATAGRIPLGASGKLLHWVDVNLENTGSGAVKRYTLEATPTLYKANGTTVAANKMDLLGMPNAAAERLIDVGCTQQEHLTTQIAEADAAAVTFHVQVTAGNSKWHTFVSVPNSKPAVPDAAPEKKNQSA